MRIRQIFEKFYYLKLCYNRSYAYLGIPVQLIGNFFIVSLWFQSQGIKNTWMLVSLFGILLVLAIVLGNIDIKTGCAHIETSVNNSINPELMNIYKKTGGKNRTKKTKQRRNL